MYKVLKRYIGVHFNGSEVMHVLVLLLFMARDREMARPLKLYILYETLPVTQSSEGHIPTPYVSKYSVYNCDQCIIITFADVIKYVYIFHH